MGVLDQLDRAQKHEDREPFLGDGIHQLIVKSYRNAKSTKNGEGVKVIFVIEKSSNPKHKPGTLACQGWYPNHPPRFPGDNGQEDLNKIVDFVIKARGIPEGSDQLAKGKESVKFLLSENGEKEQRLCGYRIVATGITRAGKPGKQDWTEVTFQHVPGQTAETIKAGREKALAVPDIEDAPATPAAQPAATQPAQAQATPAADPFAVGAATAPATPPASGGGGGGW